MLIKDQCTYRARPTGTVRNRPKINTMPIVIAGFNVLAGAGVRLHPTERRMLSARSQHMLASDRGKAAVLSRRIGEARTGEITVATD